MIDMLRSNAVAAKAGEFNFDAESDVTAPSHTEAVSWNNNVANSLPEGLGSINCTIDSCDVVISWMADLDGNFLRQYYRARTPL